MAAPRLAPARAAARLGASRRPASGMPAIRPRKALREAPSSTGQPRPASRPSRSINATFCSGVLPKPIPGSSAMRARGMPAASSVAMRPARWVRTRQAMSPGAICACMLRGSVPGICISTTGAARAATRAAAAGSWRRAVTSLMMRAPASSAAAMVAAWRVSTETGACGARARMTGRMRRSSSAGGTGSAPGRVDSPPMSRMSAPAARIASPWSMAAPWSRARPSPEKLSGVTLTMPMTSGRPGSGRPAKMGRGAVSGGRRAAHSGGRASGGRVPSAAPSAQRRSRPKRRGPPCRGRPMGPKPRGSSARMGVKAWRRPGGAGPPPGVR